MMIQVFRNYLFLVFISKVSGLMLSPGHRHPPRLMRTNNGQVTTMLSAVVNVNDHQSSQKQQTDTSSSMRHDIEVLRKEAIERIDKLSIQMEQLKEERKKNTIVNNNVDDHHIENELSRQHDELLIVENSIKQKTSHTVAVPVVDVTATRSTTTEKTTSDTTTTHQTTNINSSSNSLDLLDDTRWKIVFNIGREQGTWMPSTWGISGERLLFHVEFDFTSEPLYERDDFFQSTIGTTKRIDVVNAFIIPRGVGTHSIGRRPVPCKSTGGYKVCCGQGPMGTDIVRLYIELTEDLYLLSDDDHGSTTTSDVFCPKGRVYATCGYFVMRDSREFNNNNNNANQSPKEIAQIQHRDAILHLESIQYLLDNDEHTIFSLQRLKNMKDLYDAKKQVEITTNNLNLIRQREPEKSQLRLSKRNDVGLSKEGGVCCKVQKGAVTTEYHILGRMEVGCVDDHKH
jgi:hypothetical protein